MVSLREQAGRNDSKRQGGIIHRRDLQGGDALERIFLLEIFSLARRGSRWMGNRYALYIEYGSTARTNRKDCSFHPEYGTASAEDKIPSKTEIKGLRIIPRKEATGNGGTLVDGDGNISYIEENDVLIYQITFQDTPGKSNYYSLQIWGDDDHLGVLLDFSVDPVFTQQQGILDEVFGSSMVNWRGRVFSDELFDGKEYTLQVKEQLRSDTKYYTKRHIRLYSLSEPYYQYLLSLQNIKNEGIMGGLTNVGLAEPVRIYSNVEGGTGIAGGCQWFESLVDIKDLIK